MVLPLGKVLPGSDAAPDHAGICEAHGARLERGSIARYLRELGIKWCIGAT